MRIAVVSDIHGNRTAFEAVLKDLRETAPDLIFHGGDLADSGSSPVEIVDCIRDLGWPGVVGNTDEMLFDPGSLEAFAGKSGAPTVIWAAVREMAEATRAALGDERIAWLRGLPRVQTHGPMALVHASPESLLDRAGAGSERCGVGGGLRTAGMCGRGVRPYSFGIHSKDSGWDGRQHGQRRFVLRWRSPGGLSFIRR